MNPAPNIPYWVKTGVALFLVVFIAARCKYSDPSDFLWLSDIGLFTGALALVLNNRLLAGMTLLGTLIFDGIVWTSDLLSGWLTGFHPFHATDYMFDPAVHAAVRWLSFFHPVVPALMLWFVRRHGYDRRAFAVQSLLSAIVLLMTWLVTDPAHNINWVYGLGKPQSFVPGWLYLAGLIILIPLTCYHPVHLLMRKLGWDKIEWIPETGLQVFSNAEEKIK